MPYKLKRILFIISAMLLCFTIGIYLCQYKPSVSAGELLFYRDNQMIKKISVQAVETNQYRAHQYLTYRNTMPDSCGMLFIFNDNGTAPFRMKKQHQPFDIIAADPNGNIVILEKNVLPSFAQALPSNNPVLYRYIIVVNSGFCNSYRINEYDSIALELKKK